MGQFSILAVDDDPAILSLLSDSLGAGYDVITANSGAEALQLVRRQLFDAALVDIRMPDMDGLQLLREIKGHAPSIEVVMMTAYPDLSTAVETLTGGACDYLQKPFSLNELRHRVTRVLERRFLLGEVNLLRERLSGRPSTRGLVGTSPQMARVKEVIAQVATSDSPVLIEGESGTGKELAAEAIHGLSARSRGPFIRVNCAAIPPDLMESEFFGHARGAFTGAVADTLGLFRSAYGGTIFLDEVADLPLPLQGKLLRVLQDKEVRAVGSTKAYKVDVRVLAATNRNIEQTVNDGRFRQDLFYRLNVVRITMPPLRGRREDIPVLVTHFLRQLNARFGRDVRAVTPDAMSALMSYSFPGNVRELENLLERAYALGVTREIRAADLPELSPKARAIPETEKLPTIPEMERELIARSLRLHPNKKEAARALGISLRTMYRRLKEYGLPR